MGIEIIAMLNVTLNFKERLHLHKFKTAEEETPKSALFCVLRRE